jgi:hypothetical protein
MWKRVWIAVLTALGLSISPNATAQNPPVKSLPQLQAELTDAAVQIAREYGVSLNFSHGSVEDVERVLAKIHEHYARTMMKEACEESESSLRLISLQRLSKIPARGNGNATTRRWVRPHIRFIGVEQPFSHMDGA